MISVLLMMLNEPVQIDVDGNRVIFKSGSQMMESPIEGIRLSYVGVLKEHPDLRENPEWKTIAIRRFKEKIRSYKTEMEKITYIIEDLKKHGFVAKAIERKGHRPIRL